MAFASGIATMMYIFIAIIVVTLGIIGYCFFRAQRIKRENEQLAVRSAAARQAPTARIVAPVAEPYHAMAASPSAPDLPLIAEPVSPYQQLHAHRHDDDQDVPLAIQIQQQQRELERYARDRQPVQPSEPTPTRPPSTTPPGPWDDPLIVASRLPTEAVFSLSLLSKGGYGEVYRGTYAGESVAIKKLLPETRRDLTQIAAFFAEVRLLASMQHAHIVRYVGVAWNALSDACVVTEFMSGGDLRAVLTQWEFVDARPHGVDKQKATLALHVAHALTYLHSLQPVVLHRDLKSKNILLDESQWLAKVTDFGVSRERSDRTMTAAVGTVLWMAPEVMVGDRYDGKADVFSFGVVLSELDTHAMPYADVKEKLVSESGRPLPDTALLQRIMTGRAKVSFSEGVREDVRALGEACVAVDPTQRPNAAQVLHRMHEIARSL